MSAPRRFQFPYAEHTMQAFIAARALLARSITGGITIFDGRTGGHATIKLRPKRLTTDHASESTASGVAVRPTAPKVNWGQ
jgi:hypothetical protein